MLTSFCEVIRRYLAVFWNGVKFSPESRSGKDVMPGIAFRSAILAMS